MFSKSLTAVAFVMAFFVSVSAHAASVWWQPTGSAVNFINVTVPGYTLAMFDVDNFDGLRDAPLEINPITDTINFVASVSDFTATSTVTSNSITLFDDNQFVLSISDGSDWFEPVSWSELVPGSNVFSVVFTNGIAITTNVTPVPVPAALWLFGSGLIGLVAVARRKDIA